MTYTREDAQVSAYVGSYVCGHRRVRPRQEERERMREREKEGEKGGKRKRIATHGYHPGKREGEKEREIVASKADVRMWTRAREGLIL